MLINRKGIICHVSKAETPHALWYPINLLIPRYGDDYIEEKLGVTDPETIQHLQDEFLVAFETISKGMPDILETHSVRFDKYDWDYYLADKCEESVTVFLERCLAPEDIESSNRHASGYVWAVIERSDTPEEVCEKLQCTQEAFARAFYKKLWKIMGW
jgi:hypothetical protein